MAYYTCVSSDLVHDAEIQPELRIKSDSYVLLRVMPKIQAVQAKIQLFTLNSIPKFVLRENAIKSCAFEVVRFGILFFQFGVRRQEGR